ncbi:Agamous-like MADS-box protein [Quillaja saponaria]|uniref:Agamous-like MADS-box protein n=1 Tax=Quillaja saponaria TaxID=32244 RepID=A0AAD7PVP3_QUISA|nr:Agamous-like MADS-box protein [Quillaja saponaria]
MPRQSKGRQKVKMEKMTKESNLQVTFSKRRSGLFKKASELCTLCGVEVALIVFSPGKKVFAFGHPCVETVIDCFLNQNPPPKPSSGTMQLIEAHRNANVRELNNQLSHVLTQLDNEKKHGEELNKMKKAGQEQNWWENPIEKLNKTQLEKLKASLEDLKKKITKQADRILIQNSNPQFFTGSSSTNPFPLPNVQAGPSGKMMVMPPPLGFDHQDIKYPPTGPHGFNNDQIGYGRGYY